MTPVRLPFFLRSVPDVLGLLRDQVRITHESLQAFLEWSTTGAPEAGRRVRDLEHDGDDARRALVEALREVFSAPLDQEDLYTVSERLDAVQNSAKNVVRQAEEAGWVPDDAAARMAACALDAVDQLVGAFAALPDDHVEAGRRADAAIKAARGLEKVHRGAVAELAASGRDRGSVFLTGEIYRRYDALGDAVIHVGHRVWFSVLKEG